ncbi:ParB/RepB/Spo0J family partition protein [Dehalobacter sp.]|uniref:ParB/RepB/Spo0J family partition protein n=1 Tax=Dehalobacter sp. TaxID=1962289 RepID=UPI00258D2D04|nr:ParB/RepB/Spo0J family partition protein [Dehalobacter sp.]MDJ0305365.1 ParB/RepB/Spo0J family partition protein [Dehalobacter sp.]
MIGIELSRLAYIDIAEIHPHIDNPRKDLGDLNELAESIKAQGIMQNLTVVPRIMGSKTDYPSQDGYTVIIGHRRLAAAKLAGLTDVPCVISNMSPKEQISTMLLENMQRNDLTIYEQAQGFQMMLDFGDSIDDIAEATGFSKSTVRHRVRLLELDQEKFKKATERGGTLQDYIDLEKIKNAKTKNKVLESIGTSDFKWKLKQAIEDEARPERKAALIKELEEFAKRVKESKGLSYERAFYGFDKNDWKKPKDADKAEYFFTVDDYSITLYKKEPKQSPKKLTAAEKSFKERESKYKELTRQAYESRYEFIYEFNAAKQYIKTIQAFALKGLLCYRAADVDKVLDLLKIEKPAYETNGYRKKAGRDLINDKFLTSPEQVLLAAIYCSYDDKRSNGYGSCRDWEKKIIRDDHNESLDELYDMLIELGYELSDEEQSLRDGTHELFANIQANK